MGEGVGSTLDVGLRLVDSAVMWGIECITVRLQPDRECERHHGHICTGDRKNMRYDAILIVVNEVLTAPFPLFISVLL